MVQAIEQAAILRGFNCKAKQEQSIQLMELNQGELSVLAIPFHSSNVQFKEVVKSQINNFKNIVITSPTKDENTKIQLAVEKLSNKIKCHSIEEFQFYLDSLLPKKMEEKRIRGYRVKMNIAPSLSPAQQKQKQEEISKIIANSIKRRK